MQKYVNQLLGDMYAARKEETATSEIPEIISTFSIEDHFQDAEDWMEFDESKYPTFGEQCGLQTIQFPPKERLNYPQLADLCEAFRLLMRSFNLYVNFPDEAPVGVIYPLLVGVLDTNIRLVDQGFVEIEFCTYDTEQCPFGEHCECKKMEEEEKTFLGELDCQEDFMSEDFDFLDLDLDESDDLPF